jgi:hypothetical protein
VSWYCLAVLVHTAVHLATAHETGEHEAWTSDLHMQASAAYFGLTG